MAIIRFNGRPSKEALRNLSRTLLRIYEKDPQKIEDLYRKKLEEESKNAKSEENP